jgi:dCMP deaminase
MEVADVIAKRSPCSRRQIGAVIVDPTNRVVATGYNGFPAGLTTPLRPGSAIRPMRRNPSCEVDCPRAQPDAVPGIHYDDCLTIHAEANALMFCDRREREGGAIYVTSAVCRTCAKLVANSGLRMVVMRVEERDKHRDPSGSIKLLKDSGLHVLELT